MLQTKIPQNYTCPLRRQLSGVGRTPLINELTRRKQKPTLKYCLVLHIYGNNEKQYRSKPIQSPKRMSETHNTQACEPIDGHYRSNGQQLLLWCREHWSLKPRPLVANALQIVGLH